MTRMSIDNPSRSEGSRARAFIAVVLGTFLISAALSPRPAAVASGGAGTREVAAGVEEPAVADSARAAAERDTSGLPVSLAGFADSGEFEVYVNEEVILTGDFDLADDGSYEGGYTLSVADQSVESSVRIEVDDGGLWTSIDMSTALGPVSVVRKGGSATIVRQGDTSTVRVKPNTVLFENFSPALMPHVTSLCEGETGRKVDVPIFIVPSVVMDGSVQLLDRVERVVAGETMTFTRYVLSLPGVDVTVYIDEDGRFVFGDVPQQHAAYVRKGYERLLEREEEGGASKSEYDFVVESDVGVPMRDGLSLATDIYRPDAGGRFPVVLVRTPYKKEMNELQAKFFARRGYVYAVQDCRGRFSSPGEWEPFVNEAADGYDTVEWLAAQPWSSGKVGMIGASYLGWVQWWAAKDRPPHLTTIIPNVSPPDPHYNIPYEYGVFFLLGSIWWADVLESEATADLSGKTFADVMDKRYALLLRHLPVVDIDKKMLGRENRYWRKWIEHPDNDEYWAPANFLGHLEDVDIPVFHQSGWFDGDGIGSKLNYMKMASHGHPYQKLVLGPWGHTDQATRRYGDTDFGEEAILDLQKEYVRWLDRWLKGADNGIDEEPLVSLFVMGSNKWLHGDDYPLEGTRMTKYYLSSGGHANTSNGDGLLGPETPSGDSPPDRYRYDPGDPTPSPTFYISPEDLREIERASGAEGEEEGVSDHDDEMKEGASQSVEEEVERRRAYYAEVNAQRDDILVYDTPVLEEPLTIAGPISAVLYASTSAIDTDWFMRLARVDGQGRVHRLVEGKVRARYRESTSSPELLVPGEIYEYDLDLWHTGLTIPAGERLRLEVASASFPHFSRNLNTGAHNETSTEFVPAEQTVYHDELRPSHVLLPVIPE